MIKKKEVQVTQMVTEVLCDICCKNMDQYSDPLSPDLYAFKGYDLHADCVEAAVSSYIQLEQNVTAA